MAARALYLIPVVTVAVVVFALFVVGAPTAYVGARVHGGPTEGAVVLAWRIDVVESFRDAEGPKALDRLRVEVGTASWEGATDELGHAYPRIDLGSPAAGPLWVRITSAAHPRPLAEGEVQFRKAAWAEVASRHGGWIPGKAEGALEVRVATERGVLAIPFRESLWIEVRRRGVPVPGAKVRFAPEAVEVHLPEGRDFVETNAGGRAFVRVTPRDYAAASKVSVTGDDEEKGTWYSTLPVLAGAMHATLRDGVVHVETPIQRERVYIAIATEHGRHAVGKVELRPTKRGTSVGTFEPPELPDGSVWAVVSSEADFQSMGLVGWPLRIDRKGEPSRTFAPRGQLLLDGLESAGAVDAERRERARLLAGSFTGASAFLVVLLLVRRVRTSQRNLEQHLSRASNEDTEEEKKRPATGVAFALIVGVLCVLLGFMLLVLVSMARQ